MAIRKAHVLDGRIASLAARQFGVVARDQAVALGLSSHVIRARIRARRWDELYHGVYRVAGSPPSVEQLTIAAVFAAGPDAAACRRSAGALWRLRGVSAGHPEVIVPYSRNPAPAGVHIYRSRTIRAENVTRLGPIPVTTPTRTLLDLSSVLDLESLEDALDDAVQRRLVSVRKLGECVRGARHGVPGVNGLRRLLAVRTAGHLGESGFENVLRRLLISSGLPPPVPQYVVRERDGTFIARVDLAYPDAGVAIEADGYAYHSGRREFERDRSRQNRLINAGWRVLRVTPAQVDSDPGTTVDTVARALGLSVKRPRVAKSRVLHRS